MLKDCSWQTCVYEVLGNALKSASLIIRQNVDIDSMRLTGLNPKGIGDMRFRGIVARAVGAMCVLGAHTDCIRVGGKVRVAAHVGDSLDTSNGSGSSAGNDLAVATLVHIDPRNPIGRVVFDGSFDDSDPVHNIQNVRLGSFSDQFLIFIGTFVVTIAA